MTAAAGTSSSNSSSTPDLLLQRLSENVRKQPSKILFSYIVPGSGGGGNSTFGGKISRQFTYEQVDNETTQLGQQLLVDYGLSKGDRYVWYKTNRESFCFRVFVIIVCVLGIQPDYLMKMFCFSIQIY